MKNIIFICLLLCLPVTSTSAEQVVLKDGTTAILHDNQTWEKKEITLKGVYFSIVGTTNTSGGSCEMLLSITNYTDRDFKTLHLFLELSVNGAYQGRSIAAFENINKGHTVLGHSMWLSKPCAENNTVNISGVNSCRTTDDQYHDDCLKDIRSAPTELIEQAKSVNQATMN